MTDKILIIEDDEGVAEVLADVLAAEGFSTRVERTAAEGMRAAREDRPKAVLLDLGLPDMPGQRVLEELSSSDPDLPVVVLTGQSEVEKVVECMRLGAADYLPKPLNRQQLLDALVSCDLRAKELLSPETIAPFDAEEKKIILHALEATNWKVNEAARRLRLGRATIYRKIDRYGLKRP